MMSQATRELKTEALILKASDWKETDRLLWAFLPTEGLTKIIVKRARKHGASLAGAGQALAWHTLHLKRVGSQALSNPLRSGSASQPYSQVKGSLGSEPSWWVLAQYTPQQMFPSLKASMPSCLLGTLACEMMLGLLEAGGGSGHHGLQPLSCKDELPPAYQGMWQHTLTLFQLLEAHASPVSPVSESFSTLGATELTPWHEVVLIRWLLRVLHEEGWLAPPAMCVECGVALHHYQAQVYWHQEVGGCFCQTCVEEEESFSEGTSRAILRPLTHEECMAWVSQFAPFWHMSTPQRASYQGLLVAWRNKLLDAWEVHYLRKLVTRDLF
ncbi:MAG: DNA repair protein RecO [Vampirovibrionales bacterium]